MALFAAARQGRKDDAELGKGVWRRAHDRFRRGLDRYHQILEGVRDKQLHAELVPVANELADLLPRVRAVCAAAQRIAPSDGQDVPASEDAYLSDVHRALSKAGNALATTAEAVAMARLDGGGEVNRAGDLAGGGRTIGGSEAVGAAPDATASSPVENVKRRAEAVRAGVEDAEGHFARGG